MFPFGVIEALCGEDKPTKTPCGDGTGLKHYHSLTSLTWTCDSLAKWDPDTAGRLR